MKPEIMKFDFKQIIDKPDTLELYIYDVVAPDSYDWWSDETIESETSADFFRKKLAEYSNVKYINLYINSVGGSVQEGYGIYAQLKRHPAEKTVYIDGFAHSIASIIAMAGDTIIMYINSVMGIHNMMDYCFGNATEHRQCAVNLDSMMEGNRQLYMAKSSGKITIEKLTELMDAETILTAQQCLEYGLCDQVVEIVADPVKMTQKMQRINSSMASQIKYFQLLKQSFGDAITALNTQKAPPPVEPKPAPPAPPLENPEEKKQKFFAAL